MARRICQLTHPRVRRILSTVNYRSFYMAREAMFGPIRTQKTLKDTAASLLTEKILSGKIRPGERLNESQLSRQLCIKQGADPRSPSAVARTGDCCKHHSARDVRRQPGARRYPEDKQRSPGLRGRSTSPCRRLASRLQSARLPSWSTGWKRWMRRLRMRRYVSTWISSHNLERHRE